MLAVDADDPGCRQDRLEVAEGANVDERATTSEPDNRRVSIGLDEVDAPGSTTRCSVLDR